MPRALVSSRVARSSTAPSTMLNQPSPHAIFSPVGSEFPCHSVLSVFLFITQITRGLRFQDDLDAAVLFLAEGLVELRSLLQRPFVRDDEGRVELPLPNAPQQVVRP